MDYDSPDRYDLTDNNTDEPATPTMESHPQGDYVEFATYDGLLDAYNDLLKTLSTIHDLSQ